MPCTRGPSNAPPLAGQLRSCPCCIINVAAMAVAPRTGDRRQFQPQRLDLSCREDSARLPSPRPPRRPLFDKAEAFAACRCHAWRRERHAAVERTPTCASPPGEKRRAADRALAAIHQQTALCPLTADLPARRPLRSCVGAADGVPPTPTAGQALSRAVLSALPPHHGPLPLPAAVYASESPDSVITATQVHAATPTPAIGVSIRAPPCSWWLRGLLSAAGTFASSFNRC
jgi:hypothetical protein